MVLWPLRGAQGPLRLWLLPALVLATALIVYPVLDLARVALTDTGAYGTPHRYTLASFRACSAAPEFYQMAGVTLSSWPPRSRCSSASGWRWRSSWTRRGGGARG